MLGLDVLKFSYKSRQRFVSYIQHLIKDLPAEVPKDPSKAKDDASIRRNPNEVKFFKHLYAEFEKVSCFFEKAKKEMKIRYDRVTVGKQIFSSRDSAIMPDKWTSMERSAIKLHNSLLLLEGFAIMNYCAFSKILKKHDKRTGYSTKVAFMTKVVNKANFAAYPDILGMIQGCEELIDHSSQELNREKKSNLGEDEKLFLGLVHKINSEEDVVKGDDDSITTCSFQGDRAMVSPVNKKRTITRTPIQIDSIFMDLNTIRRLRSVSFSSLVSESSIPSMNHWKHCRNASFDWGVKKHHLPQVTFEPSKKQRCL